MRADCQETGKSCGPKARSGIWDYVYTYILIIITHTCLNSEYVLLTSAYVLAVYRHAKYIGPRMSCVN